MSDQASDYGIGVAGITSEEARLQDRATIPDDGGNWLRARVQWLEAELVRVREDWADDRDQFMRELKESADCIRADRVKLDELEARRDGLAVDATIMTIGDLRPGCLGDWDRPEFGVVLSFATQEDLWRAERQKLVAIRWPFEPAPDSVEEG